MEKLTGFRNKFPYRFDKEKCDKRKVSQLSFIREHATTKTDNYYNLYYRDISKNGIEYFFNDYKENLKLSSGESLILIILLWKFHAQKLKEEYEKNNNPIQIKTRILLLDEPDAHMHPSLIEDFLSLLSGNELLYLNLQVIITTHSPITVLLMPNNNLNIFLMSKTKNEDSKENIYNIQPINNKALY